VVPLGNGVISLDTIVNPSFAQVYVKGTNPQVNVSPSTNGNESSIAFYANANRTGDVAGSIWYVGQAVSGAAADSFAIAAYAVGKVLTISSAGAVSIPGTLSASGATVAYAPWAAGRVNAAGALVASVSTTQSTWTPARTATGNYTITFATAHPQGANYTCLVSLTTPATPSPMIQAYNSSSTVVYIYTYQNASSADLAFSFAVL